MDVDPALIPLLRGTAPFLEPIPVRLPAAGNPIQYAFDFGDPAGTAEQTQLGRLDDGGNPARAILLGTLLCLPFWGAMAVLCHRLLF